MKYFATYQEVAMRPSGWDLRACRNRAREVLDNAFIMHDSLAGAIGQDLSVTFRILVLAERSAYRNYEWTGDL
jgi:hypothetical protein